MTGGEEQAWHTDAPRVQSADTCVSLLSVIPSAGALCRWFSLFKTRPDSTRNFKENAAVSLPPCHDKGSE